MSELDDAINKSNLRRKIEKSWDDLQDFLDSISDAQKTELTDAQGWTVKDHLIHLAVWEDSLTALLEGKSRAEALGVDDVVWQSHDVDAMNAVIQKAHQSMPLNEVVATLGRSHDRMVAQIETLTDDDLMRPHRDFQPDSTRDEPVIGWIVGNSFEHFADHMAWMQAIAESE